jgi:hypothetical protein
MISGQTFPIEAPWNPDAPAPNAGEIVVVDGVGHIQTPDPRAVIAHGKVWVREDQARRAEPYGWWRVGEVGEDGMVLVERGYAARP